MVDTGTLIWLVLAGTGAVCVISTLGVFASIMRHETDLHDLRNRVAELRYSYTLQIARLHGHLSEPEEGEVDILDSNGDPVEVGEAVPDAEAAVAEPRAAA